MQEKLEFIAFALMTIEFKVGISPIVQYGNLLRVLSTDIKVETVELRAILVAIAVHHASPANDS